MTKLKTLKDIKANMLSEVEQGEYVSRHLLKKEAIKWVKESRTLRAAGNKRELNEYSWMDFFNIKEEDLK